MKYSSLNLRLSLAAAISIVGALTLSGFFLLYLFERHVVRRVDQELLVYVKQLAASLEVGSNSTPA
nr:histidine kinase [Alphaproteobacteria bacterium]